MISVDFNTYVHARPDGRVFYVGKGSTERAHDFKNNRNKHYLNVVGKYGAENILVGKLDCSSETIAFDLEKGLIKCFRRMGVELTNMTDGGEGASGYMHTDASRSAISENTKLALVGKTEEFSARQKTLWANSAYRESVTAKIHAGTRNEKFREARRNQSLGLKYLTNESVNVSSRDPVEIENLLMQGYRFGKKKYLTSTKASDSAKKRWASETERKLQAARTEAHFKKLKGLKND